VYRIISLCRNRLLPNSSFLFCKGGQFFRLFNIYLVAANTELFLLIMRRYIYQRCHSVFVFPDLKKASCILTSECGRIPLFTPLSLAMFINIAHIKRAWTQYRHTTFSIPQSKARHLIRGLTYASIAMILKHITPSPNHLPDDDHFFLLWFTARVSI